MNNLQVLIGQIKRGNISNLILKKENVDAVDETVKTLLMYAAEYGRLNVFNQLIDLNAQIDKQDSNGYTALMYAAEKKESVDQKGKMDIVTCLIEDTICNINAKNNKGYTSLILALKTNDDDGIARIILDADRDQNTDYINAKENEDGKTALIYAAKKGYNYIVKELIKKGADIEIEDFYARNAFMEASLFQKIDIMNTILEQAKKQKIEIDKYVNIKDIYGNTALILDVLEYNTDPEFEEEVLKIAELLIEIFGNGDVVVIAAAAAAAAIVLNLDFIERVSGCCCCCCIVVVFIVISDILRLCF
jgi:ankyrin repeat protein